jgi:hypothetical protein
MSSHNHWKNHRILHSILSENVKRCQKKKQEISKNLRENGRPFDLRVILDIVSRAVPFDLRVIFG